MAPKLRPRTNRNYMTLPQLGAYLGFPTKHADESARKWCRRTGVRMQWRGNAYLVHPDDVDAILDGLEPVSA